MYALVNDRGKQYLMKPGTVVTVDFRPGEVKYIALDNSRGRRVLGWTPQYTLATGMPLAAKWYRETRKD